MIEQSRYTDRFGEPCLQSDLPELLKRIKALGCAAKLDTNGLHPEMLKTIIDERLADYVAMDVKNSPAKYARTCGRESVDLAPLMTSARLAGSGIRFMASKRFCVSGSFFSQNSATYSLVM